MCSKTEWIRGRRVACIWTRWQVSPKPQVGDTVIGVPANALHLKIIPPMEIYKEFFNFLKISHNYLENILERDLINVKFFKHF